MLVKKQMLCSHWRQMHPFYCDTVYFDRMLRMLNMSFLPDPFFESKIFLTNAQPHFCSPPLSYVSTSFPSVGQSIKEELYV